MNNVNFGRLRRTIFIILIVIAFSLALPIQIFVFNKTKSAIQDFKQNLSTNFGIDFSYESISPSILSNLNVKNITISETSGEELMQIEKIKISYKLLPLLKKDFQKGFENIIIDGIKIDVKQVFTVIEKISSFKTQENDKKNIKKKQKDKISFEEIVNLIPQNIKLKNISILYSDENVNSVFALREIILKNNERAENLSFQIDCRANAEIYNLKQNIIGNINLNGTIQNHLDNSQISLKISNLTNGEYTLNKLNLLATYNQNIFEIHTIQSLIPAFFSLQFDEKNQKIAAKFETQNLKPSNLISTNKRGNLFSKIKNLNLNTTSEIEYNLNSNKLAFSSFGLLNIPQDLFNGGVEISYDVKGDENEIFINKFNADGKNCKANVNLSLIYKTLQISGLVDIPYFVLPNKNEISTEIYFDSLEKGFLAFAPQLFIGDKSLTALQLKLLPEENSYDFSFEAFDYYNTNFRDVGSLKFDGSYLTKSKYIQTSLNLNSLYVGSFINLISQFLNDNSSLNSIENFSKDFIFSGDAYFSTDFTSISYNIPYILFANTKKENQVLMISANGNEQQIQMQQLNLIYGKYAFGASAEIDVNSETKDAFFSTDLIFENVPYHFSGTLMNKLLSINGDYNTLIDVDFSNSGEIFGSTNFENLPVLLKKSSFIISTQTGFSFEKENGFKANVEKLEIDIDDSKSKKPVSPKIIFAGNITKYGAQFSTVAYSDLYTTLEGKSDFRLNFQERIFNSAGLTLNLKNPLNSENIFLELAVSNPNLVNMDLENLKENIYITLQTQLNNFGLNRFSSVTSSNNFLTGNIFASGTINHPYVAFNIENLSMQQGNKIMNLNAALILEDHNLIIDSVNMTKGKSYLKDVSANFSLDTFTGYVNAFYHTESAGKTLDAPIKLSVVDAQKTEEKFFPASFVATLTSEGLSGTYFRQKIPLNFTLFYSPEIITLTSGEKFGLYATYFSSGEASVSINSPKLMSISGNGKFSANKNEFNLNEIEVDLKELFKYINLDEWVIVENGIAKGAVSYEGSFSEPILSGEVNIYEPEAKVPIALPVKLKAEMTPITISNNEIYVNKNTYSVKNKPTLDADCRIVLNGWGFDYLECYFKSVNNQRVNGKIATPFFTVDANMLADLYLYYGGDDSLFEIDGSINGESLYFEANITDVASSLISTSDEEPLNFVSNLKITTGTHSAIAMNPIIRAVLAPNTKFSMSIDNRARNYDIDGIFEVKSGDIAYLNRNFYIKSGLINFNAEKISNPKVTLNAETREKDDEGQNVRIIFSVENQYLQELSPRFSSIPAKSETEILSLLGQIVLADSDSATDFLFAAGGYALQSSVGRQVENKLRQLLNFDILSLHTNFLQNTLSSRFGTNSSTEQISFGNLFDNSTVYIGKYLGSNLYIDAMLNVSFKERKQSELQVSAGNLIFQPEFGMELESPFGNIRWNVAPDINALLNKQYVPSSSVTLSWKIAF